MGSIRRTTTAASASGLAAIAALALAACGSAGSGATGAQASASTAAPAVSGSAATGTPSGYGSTYGSTGSYGSSGSGSGSSGASGAASAGAKSAHATTVRTAHTSDGTILVNSRGFTLYLFTADKRNHDACVGASGCTAEWPPLTVTGKPTAGSGVKASLLGTITIPQGKHQVTYAGHPLYTFTDDDGPAETGYVGQTSFGGAWYGVSPSGGTVK